MGTFSIGKALAGAGTGLVQSGLMAYKDQLESAREQRLADLQAQRDQRLFGQQQTLEKDRQTFQGAQTDKEIAARKELETDRYAHSLTERGMEIEGRSALTDKEIAARKEIVEKQEAGANARSGAANARADKELGLRAKEFELKRKVAEIEMKNIETIDRLRSEYEGATPERQSQIRDTISVLKGNEKDNWIVTGVNPDPMTGRATEYIKVNKTTGEEMPLNYGRGAPVKGEKKPSKADLAMQFFTDDEPEKKKPESGRSRSGLIRRE